MNTTSQHYAINYGHPYILIIDDDPDDQILLKVAFDSIAKNLCLHFVGSAQEALEYLEHTQDTKLTNLIVTDYNLPKYNGIKLLQQLDNKERYRGIPKVILSNFHFIPCMDPVKTFPGKCFTKPDSFNRMKQLAAQLLQLCISKGSMHTE